MAIDASLIDALKYYRVNPVAFVRDILNVQSQPEQSEFLEALAKHKFAAVKSGHGIGKTAGEAWAILWFMFTHPFCRVPCTAPTGHQLDDILWPEVSKWMKMSILKDVFEMTKTKLWMKGYEDSWFAVPRACNKPENLQGFHGCSVLFVVDEASGVPKEIMEVIEGALTNEGAHLLMAGNPNSLEGVFYDAFTKDRALYSTHTFNAENSGLVSEDYCQRIASKFGKDSDVYRVRVLGEFPTGNPDALIRLDEIEAAIGREVSFRGPLEIGVDPARYGDDMSVICARKGLKCFPLISFSGINTTRLSGETAKLIRELRRKFEYYYVDKATGEMRQKRIRVKVDDTGIGGGVTDQLEEKADLLGIDVIPVNFGGTSNDDNYYGKAAEMWGNIKKLLPEISLPEDQELVAQFTTRKYTIRADGLIILEDKEKLKKRGLKSPDKADACVLAFAQDNRPRWGLA